MSARVEVVDYNPRWPDMFVAERQLLRKVLRPWLAGPIEHVGSTAVLGLRAKPVIDIMAGVASLEGSRDAIRALAGSSYLYWPYKADVMHWFCKPSAELRTHHLHLVPIGSELWRERLAFRDRLRTDPVARAEYARLKDELARLHPDDREAYTDGKSEFITQLVARELQAPPR